ncbi:MAG: RNA methyltransferase [Opitutae bacterium]|nr:RNA methyltransferase [Opitutae bacterium]
MRTSELKLCGLAAVRARWQRDPASIQRLFFDYATGRRIGVMCKALAANRKIYRCVETAELEKVAGSVHHGGIVAVVAEPALRTPTARDVQAWATQHAPVLLLDRIGNAHNLGALARTAAFFGVKHCVLVDDPTAARPNDAAYRVAEGGLEALTVWIVGDLPEFLRTLAAGGYETLGAATRGAQALGRKTKSPHRQPPPRALVMGNEEHGLAPEVAAACTRLVTIPGTNAVESLNVSVAGAVLMWELFGRRG